MAVRENSGAAAVAVATTDEFFTDVLREDAMSVELHNGGANALDAFEIWVKAHSQGQFVLMHSDAGDFTTPKGLIKAASGSPVALAAGARVVLVLAGLTSVYAISLRASSAVGPTTLNWKTRIGD